MEKEGRNTLLRIQESRKVDHKSKLIDGYEVTDASVHDSQALSTLLDGEAKGQDFYADSAYKGEEHGKIIKEKGMVDKVHDRAYRNKPLTEEEEKTNKEKSKIRVRVEHVLGFMEQSMNGLRLRSIGMQRAKGIIGLINLTYNMYRFEQIKKLNILTVY